MSRAWAICFAPRVRIVSLIVIGCFLVATSAVSARADSILTCTSSQMFQALTAPYNSRMPELLAAKLPPQASVLGNSVVDWKTHKPAPPFPDETLVIQYEGRPDAKYHAPAYLAPNDAYLLVVEVVGPVDASKSGYPVALGARPEIWNLSFRIDADSCPAGATEAATSEIAARLVERLSALNDELGALITRLEAAKPHLSGAQRNDFAGEIVELHLKLNELVSIAKGATFNGIDTAKLYADGDSALSDLDAASHSSALGSSYSFIDEDKALPLLRQAKDKEHDMQALLSGPG